MLSFLRSAVPGFVSRRLLVASHDLFMMIAAFPLAILVRQNFDIFPQTPGIMLNGSLVLAGTSLIVFLISGLHRGMWRYASPADLVAVVRTATITVIIFTVAMFLIGRLDGVARSVLVIFWLIACLGLCFPRILYASLVQNERRGAFGRRIAGTEPALLIGGGDAAALVITMSARGMLPQHRIVGILDDASLPGRTIYGAPVLGAISDWETVYSRLSVQGMAPTRLVFTTPHHQIGYERVAAITADAQERGVAVQQLPELLISDSDTARKPITAVPAMTVMSPRIGYWSIKRGLDFAGAGILLIFFAPIMLLIAALVRLTIGHPVFFDQVRPGLAGEEFVLHKFRTMRDPLGEDGRLLTDEERTPWAGYLLRRTRLDELPQLLNVLVGEMSFIGPRPLLPRDLPDVGREVIERRASVRPGITGWAQVNGGQLLAPEPKLKLDLHYIENASLAFDIKITIRTMGIVAKGDKVEAVKEMQERTS